MKNELYNSEQVADYFHVRVETIRDWTRRGILKGFKAGRDWRYSQQNLDDCMKALQAQTEEKRQTLEERHPGLTDTLAKEEEHYTQKGHNREWPAMKQWILDFVEHHPHAKVRWEPEHGIVFSNLVTPEGGVTRVGEEQQQSEPELAIVRP